MDVLDNEEARRYNYQLTGKHQVGVKHTVNGFVYTYNVILSCRSDTMQITSTNIAYCNQPHDIQHENESQPSATYNLDRMYEVILPLPYEPTRLTNQQVMSERAENVQTHELEKIQITSTGQQVSQKYLLDEVGSHVY